MGSKKNKKVKEELEEVTEKHTKRKKQHKETPLEPEVGVEPAESVTQVKKSKKKKAHKVANDVDSHENIKPSAAEDEIYIKNEEIHLENGDLKLEEFDEKDFHDDKNLANVKQGMAMPNEDMLELLRRMEAKIPDNDNLTYRSRSEKLNWDEIRFNNYTVDQCKGAWALLQKRVRRYRLLKELLNDAKEYLSTPIMQKSKKAKHPDLPPKPPSSYMIFFRKRKDQILAENPRMECAELQKKISQLFKDLPQEKKSKYERLAAQAKKEYFEKLEVFYLNHPEIPKPEKGKRGRKPKSDSAPKIPKIPKPKKPHTPFHFYMEEQLKKQPDASEMARTLFKEQCKEQWKKMSDKKKLIWINWAEQDMQRYEDEVKNFMREHPTFEPTPMRAILTKDEKILKERLQGKPLKPPNSAYSLFSRIMLQSDEIKKINAKDRMNFISNQWKNLSEEEKTKYKDKANEMMEQYKVDYAKYVDSLPEDKKQMELQKPSRKRTKAEPEKKEQVKKEKKRKTTDPVEKKTPKKRKLAKEPTTTKLEEPKTPPISPFKYFLTTYEGDEKSAKQSWKLLTPNEKKKYEQELVKIKHEYIVDFEKFLNSLSKQELEEFSRAKQMESKTASDDEYDDDDEDDDDEEEESSVESSSGEESEESDHE